MPPVNTWSFSSKQWLSQILPSSRAHARLLTFEYSAPPQNDFSWQHFFLLGDELLTALFDTRCSEDKSRPLLCVCHSLGGIILKQTLCIANEQHYHYGSLVNALAGIIFLGTPHTAHTDSETLSRCITIYNATAKISAEIPGQRLLHETAMLAHLATRFEAVYTPASTLSVIEGKATRVRESRMKSRMQLLTDEALCTTHTRTERFMTFPQDHASLCNFDLISHEQIGSIRSFVSEILDNVDQVISSKMQAMEFQYATTTAYSPTGSELIDLEQPLHPTMESVMATNGTSQFDFEIVQSVKPRPGLIAERKQPRLPCHILPPQNPNRVFVGRDDILDAISAALLPPKGEHAATNQSSRQFSLCGMGGIGKTEIAIEFTSRYLDRFDAIFWIRADEIAKLDDSYQEISLKLGLEDQDECKSHVITRSLVKGWLSNPQKLDIAGMEDFNSTASSFCSEATWLVIFDNADDASILTEYWPQGSGSVLVTSRDPVLKSLFSTRSSGLDLKSFDDGEGAALLLRLTDADDNLEEDAEDLARLISSKMGGLPLAISQMAGFIQRQDLALSEFLTLYEDSKEHASLYGTNLQFHAQSYPYSVATVWAFEKLSNNARGLLKVMSFMDPDYVQEDILFAVATQMFSSQNLTNKDYRDARTELLRSSLIKRDKKKNELSEYRLSVHRLVQDAARAKMTGDEFPHVFQLLVSHLWANWPSAMPKPSKPSSLGRPKASDKRLEVGRWPVCAALYPHVLSLKKSLPLVPSSSNSTKLQFAALLNDAAWYQHERGRTRQFDGFFDLAQSLCEGADGDDRNAILSDIHFCLGAIAADTNDHTASRQHKEASFRLQKAISDSIRSVDERLALCYSELAISRIQDGRLDEGVAALHREKEIRQSLGTYKPLSRESNLGLAYMLQGKYDVAESLLVQSLETREKLHGKNDKESFRTGRILYALGNLRNLQGREHEAYDCHQQAYRQFSDTIGLQNHRTADVAHKIAEHMLRLGRYEEAITKINEALQTYKYDADIYKPELARTTFLKGKVFQKQGKKQKAGVTLKVVGNLLAELLPGDRKDVMDLTTIYFDSLVTFWSR